MLFPLGLRFGVVAVSFVAFLLLLIFFICHVFIRQIIELEVGQHVTNALGKTFLIVGAIL